jgi:O-succinylbenzoic acid--CoA ligase
MSALTEIIDQQAELHPNQIFISENSLQISFAELKDFCLNFGTWLAEQTKDSISKFAVKAGVNAAQALTILAIGYNDQQLYLLNPRSSAIDQEKILKRINPQVLVDLDYLNQSTQDCAKIQLAADLALKNSLKKSAAKKTTSNPSVQKDFDLAVLSSGSTGEPKIICHNWKAFITSAQSVNQHLQANPQSKFGLALPLCHVGGLAVIMRALCLGSTVSIFNKDTKSQLSLNEFCQLNKISHISLVPSQLDAVLESENAKEHLLTLQAALIGGSSITKKQITKYQNSGLPIFISYGMSEAAATIAIADLNSTSAVSSESPLVLGSVLKHLKVEASSNSEKPAEILLSGDSLFCGYQSDSGELITAELPFATKDLGLLIQGQLAVIGRADRMFISGGENIYPEEIERALEQHDAIERAFVVGVSSNRWGKRPVAFITSNSLKLDRAALRQQLAKNLAKYKVPAHIFYLKSESKAALVNGAGPLQKIKFT